jgi:hypothetical protein
MISNIHVTRIYSFFAVTTLLLVFISPTSAQTTSVTDAATPSALTPGAPAGSYALSGFENVNQFNGNLNFALPLVHVGGRGGAEFTIMLNIEQHWRIRTPKPPKNCELTGTCNLRVPWPGWWGNNVDYGPGVLQGRQPGVQCGNLSLTRLTLTVPGGTEFELRDQNYGGQPLPFQCNPAQGASRGTVFVTADGSAATFISDTSIYDNASQNSIVFYPSGYLMLRDGTRYRIDEGKVTWLRDRNGNKLTFTYSGWKVTTITDSLNRQTTKLIDAYGNVSQEPFTGTVQPIGVIPLDQGCNIIAPGNGVLLQEQVTSVRGPDPGSSNPVPAPDNGVFIDLQTIGKGYPTVEIKQNIKVQQGRVQIETGPNQVIKDAGAGTISFTAGPQIKRVF